MILAVDFQGGIENAWSNVATFVPKLFAALDQLQVAPRIVTGLWYAILAAVVGSVIVAVGGGGIRTMQRYWDRMAGKAEERGPELRQQAQASAAQAQSDQLYGDGRTAEYPSTQMVDADGDKLGNIESIYVDDQTGEPQWALVNTGLFGTKSTFVPLAQAARTGDQVQVPYQKQLVKDAPRIDPDQHLSESEEQELWRHYGLDYGTTTADYDDRDVAGTGLAGGDVDSGDRDRDAVYDEVPDTAVGRDTSGPTTDDAMTRSEEELRVGTQTRDRGRARLRKYVVTETQQVTVPVQREEVRVEREPITDANLGAATSGPDISEEEHEVTLREEEVVVDKRAVPKERVRLDTETVTEDRQVSEEVRKEQIEVEGEQDRLRQQDRR